MRQWAALRRTLRTPPAHDWKPFPPPTDATLDCYEQDRGIRLPLSYRSFCKVFGPGEVAYEYRIYMPGYPGNQVCDLATVNALIRDHAGFENCIRFYSDPEQIRRAVFFSGADGILVGWDPADIQDRRQHEYGIYEWGHGEALKKLANSFCEFIDEVCLGPDPPDWNHKRFGTRRAFSPVYDI